MINKTHEANHWIHDFILTMESVLYKPSRKWFSKFIFGALLSCSTVASWICAMGEEQRYKKAYHHLWRLGVQNTRTQKVYASRLIECLKTVLLDFIWRGTIHRPKDPAPK